MAEDRKDLAAEPHPPAPARGQEALRDRAELLRTLGDNLPDGFIYQVTGTPDGGRRFTYLSAGVERLLGVPQAEALADPGALYGLIHPDDAPRVAAAEAESLAESKPFDCEFRIRTRAGLERWVHCRSAPERLSDGSVAWDGLLTDVTAGKRAEASVRASEGRLRLFIEDAPAAIAMFDRDMRYLAVSRRWLADYGVEGDILGKSHYEVFPEIPEHWKEVHRRALAGEVRKEDEDPFERADGTTQWLRWEVRPWHTAAGAVGGIIIFAEEVTGRKRVERALRESEARFRLLAETIPQLAWTARPDGHIFWYNRRWYEYTGTTPAQMEGWGWQAVHDPAVLPQVLERWKASLASGQPFDMVFPLRGADGAFRPFLTKVVPLKDESGRVAQWFGTNTDISEQTRAEEAARESLARAERARRELELQKDALDQAAIVAVTDVKGTITYVNDKFCEISGYSRAELLGQNHRILNSRYHPIEFFREMYATIGRGQVWRGEIRNRAKDGHFYWVDTVIVPFPGPDGRPERYVAIRHDVTERKRAEEALRDEARRKDRFISMLAHELRNPLAPVGNAMHLLGRSREPAVVDKVHEIVTRQVAHLSHIVDDLLDVSRVARGKVELRRERVDLGRVARQAVEDQAAAFDRAGIGMAVELPDTPVWVEGDRTRLTQVVTNLLANAAKFTDRGGRATIRLRRDGRQAVLTVADTGVGMDTATLGRLFEPFAQADQSLARTRGGLGLGLALVKGFVELHGGTVAAASAGAGKGSEFTVRLPAAAEPPALTSGPVPTARPPTARKRVLIVEDNKDSADSLRMVFELTGYDVTVAYTGPEGAEAARRVRPDLVICDIGLPGMDGYAVAQRIRADLAAERPVLVALTGYGEAADRDKALAAGFDRHFTKPADPAALEAVLTSRA